MDAPARVCGLEEVADYPPRIGFSIIPDDTDIACNYCSLRVSGFKENFGFNLVLNPPSPHERQTTSLSGKY